MNPTHLTHKTAANYAEELMRQRREDYLIELNSLQEQTQRKQWFVESSQVASEMACIAKQPLPDLGSVSNVFPALAMARSRYHRDIGLMLRASGITLKSSTEAHGGGLLQKAIAYLVRLMVRPTWTQPAMG